MQSCSNTRMRHHPIKPQTVRANDAKREIPAKIRIIVSVKKIMPKTLVTQEIGPKMHAATSIQTMYVIAVTGAQQHRSPLTLARLAR